MSSSFVISYIQIVYSTNNSLNHKYSKFGVFFCLSFVCFVLFCFCFPQKTSLFPNFILCLHQDLSFLHVKNGCLLLWMQITDTSMISTFPFSPACLSLQLHSLPYTSSLPNVQNAWCFINRVSVTLESCLFGYQYDFVEYFIASINTSLLKVPPWVVILPIV